MKFLIIIISVITVVMLMAPPTWAQKFNDNGGKNIAGVDYIDPAPGQSNQEKILQGHTDVVLDVTFSPDGSKLASVSRDQTVRIWDCTSLTMTTDVPSDTDGTRDVPVTVLRGHKESIYSVCISKDGQVLAAASWMGEVRIWSLPSGELLQTLQAHRQGVTCVAIAPDSQFLATGGADKSVKLWNVADGQLLGTLQGHTSGVLHVAFSLDGTALASAGLDTTVKLWDRQDLKVLKTLTGHSGGGGNFPHPGYVNCIAYASDSRTLASASHDKSVRLWNILATEEESPTVLTGHTDTISSVAISPSDARIASGSFDRSIRLWHGTTGEVIHVLTGHTGEVTAVTFSPDGQWLASASFDHTVRLWKMKPDN